MRASHLAPPVKFGPQSAPLGENPVEFRPKPEARSPDDPIDVAKRYVNRAWVQNLVPLRTECLICHKTSPIVHVRIGTLAFGDPRMLRRGNSTNRDVDITEETVREFAKLGWRFQFKRSYCPDCKGLGAI